MSAGYNKFINRYVDIDGIILKNNQFYENSSKNCLQLRVLNRTCMYLLLEGVPYVTSARFSGQLFRIFDLFCFSVAFCCFIGPSARYGGHVLPSLTANSILKSFLRYE